MAFFAKLAHICEIKEGLDNLQRAKINAQREQMGLPPIIPWTEELKIKILTCIRTKILAKISPCCYKDRVLCPGVKVCHGGTYPNDILRSFVAFFGGALLSFLWFLLMVYQLRYPPPTAMITCVILGTLLSLGMAFTSGVRCMVLLTLPTLFSSKGRTVLLGYAFVLVLQHPMQNFRHNVNVMSDSATCGQQLAYNTTKEIVDTAMAPVASILDDIRQLINTLVQFAKRLRRAFLELKRLFKEVTESIKMAFSWLGNMVNVCNDKMGAPYQKCRTPFVEAAAKCRSKLGIVKFLCGIVDAVSHICHIARIGELLCLITESIKNFVVSKINLKVTEAITDMYEMFYFNVTLEYHYNVTMEQSKSYKEVRKDIMNEIDRRLQPIQMFGTFSNIGLMFMMVMLILKAVLYRRKYLTKDGFDNHYITDHINDIDEKRHEREKETILPLNWKEDGRYIKTSTRLTDYSQHDSIRLAKSERRKLITGVVLFMATFLHAAFYIVCDYGLYWLMSMIRHHGRVDINESLPSAIKIHVQGDGILADIYRTLINQFDPQTRKQLSLDTAPCLPNPSVPNYFMYKTIGAIFGTCFVLVLVQNYGLRLRHVVCSWFYPEREKQRAVWLYNHILCRRGGFLKHLRRQMRKDHEIQQKKDEICLTHRLAARSKFAAKVLRLFGHKMTHCLACGKIAEKADKESFVNCANTGCKATYCQDCFTDINNLCTVCMKPIDYGDFSDFSEERDSSDDETAKIPENDLDYTYQYQIVTDPLSDSSSDEDEDEEQGRGTGHRKKIKNLASVDDLRNDDTGSSISESEDES